MIVPFPAAHWEEGPGYGDGFVVKLNHFDELPSVKLFIKLTVLPRFLLGDNLGSDPIGHSGSIQTV